MTAWRVSPCFEDIVRDFQATPLFHALATELDALVHSAEPRAYVRGDAALAAADPGSFLLQTGRGQITRVMENGARVTIDVVYPGEVWGLTFACDALLVPGDLFITSSRAFGYYIPRWAARRVYVESPAMVERVLELVAARLVAARKRIRDFAMVSVEGRVAIALAQEALYTGSPHVTMTQEEQASQVGASREQVTRVHDRLRSKGHIETVQWGRGVLVREPARLLSLYRR